MGVDHTFHLMKAVAYQKLLRPKLIKYYGPVCLSNVIQEETRRLQKATMIKNILSIRNLTLKNSLNVKGPFQAFGKVKKERTDELWGQIKDTLYQNSIKIQSIRNHFLRMQEFLQTTDQFYQMSTGGFKVSSEIQVENYVQYLKFAVQAIKDYTGEWQNEYSDVDQALEMLNIVKKTMEQEKYQYLILHSV